MADVAQDILDVVGALHEGVVDDDSWTSGLDALSDVFAGAGIFLGTLPKGAAAFELHGHRLDPAGVAVLAGPVANPVDNPFVAVAPHVPLRRPVTVDDIGGWETLRQSRAWRDFGLGFGINAPMGTVLERQPDRIEIMMLLRAKGEYTAAETRVFACLIPHVARAWRVRRILDDWREKAGGMAAALDLLERGVVIIGAIVGAGGEIRFANRSADRLLSSADGLDAPRGRLRAGRPHKTEQLLAMIGRAAGTAVGTDAVAVDALALDRPTGQAPLAVIAEPIAPGHSEYLGHTAQQGAILFVSDGDACVRPTSERLAAVYGLTAAEAQLASQISIGLGVGAAAAAQGISENTAKSHLKAIFEKVGVNRQTQLVRRIMADIGGLMPRPKRAAGSVPS